jgi:1-deoxy-D-xylulose-5-phosphate reductoisomerase
MNAIHDQESLQVVIQWSKLLIGQHTVLHAAKLRRTAAITKTFGFLAGDAYICIMQQKKGIAILGSTGSIGTQALEVISAFPEYFDLQVITAQSNAELLIEQARKFQPNTVVICDESRYAQVKEALIEEDIHVYTGQEALSQVVEAKDVDTVLTALVGYAGLKPTISAISAGKDIALANKETLVVAGDLVTRLAREKGVNIYPVDSEHSAIFQCLAGEFHNPLEKIYLTASGGPFRGWNTEQLKNVTKEQALKHPNWSMGAKITIDSATMMNKGLEVIEAKWLFNLKPEQIDVIVHPQSIIHSLVQFRDGSMKAQMGLPDMKLPIQYALTYPERFPTEFPRFSFMDYPQLTFEQPDRKSFRNLDLAYEALAMGGSAACVLNAANEITVQQFLEDKIGFTDIARINEKVMNAVELVADPGYEEYVELDAIARGIALKEAGGGGN